MKDEAHHNLWRTCFQRGHGPVVSQTTEWITHTHTSAHVHVCTHRHNWVFWQRLIMLFSITHTHTQRVYICVGEFVNRERALYVKIVRFPW